MNSSLCFIFPQICKSWVARSWKSYIDGISVGRNTRRLIGLCRLVLQAMPFIWFLSFFLLFVIMFACMLLAMTCLFNVRWQSLTCCWGRGLPAIFLFCFFIKVFFVFYQSYWLYFSFITCIGMQVCVLYIYVYTYIYICVDCNRLCCMLYWMHAL